MKRNSDDGGVNLVIFDADDDCEKRRKELLEWKNKVGVEFELFLFPNDKAAGELEDLLEQIINSDNRPVMNCWRMYEDSLKDIILPWKGGMPLTIPAKKTKIKEANRDYTNTNHWDLHSQKLWEGILGFLCIHLF